MYIKIPVVRDFVKIERLFNIVTDNNLGYLAGGMIRFMSSNKLEPAPYRDIDVFTKGLDQYKQLVKILKYEEHLSVKSETEMSITFKTDNNEVWKDCPMINLVKPINKNKLLTYGNTLEDILENFDFSICRVGLISKDEVLCHEAFPYDEKNKRITILKMESPIAIIARLCKYAEKGYKVNIPSIVEIFRDWDKRGQEYKDKIFKALDKMNSGVGYSRHSSFYDRSFHEHVETCSPTRNDKIVKGQAEYLGKDFDIENVVETSHHKNLLSESPFSANFDDENLYDLIRIG